MRWPNHADANPLIQSCFLSGRPCNRRIRYAMKQLMTLMLGLSIALGSVAVVFAQDTVKKEDTAKKSPKKKKAPKKEETPKKDTK